MLATSLTAVLALIIFAASKEFGDDWEEWGVDLGVFDWTIGWPPEVVAAIVLGVALVIALAAITWSTVWMARQGEPGENRFGPTQEHRSRRRPGR